MERKTYILKVTEKNELTPNKVFICNRNSDDYDKLYSDIYIDWFQYYALEEMNISDGDVEILQILDYSNINCKDQKFINIYKQQYIDKFNALEENNVLCNKLLNNNIKNIRNIIQERYEDIYNTVAEMTYSDIYTVIKEIWFSKYKSYLSSRRFEIINQLKDELPYNQLCVLVVFKNYLFDRKRDFYKYPFDQKRIFFTIKQILREERLNNRVAIA